MAPPRNTTVRRKTEGTEREETEETGFTAEERSEQGDARRLSRCVDQRLAQSPDDASGIERTAQLKTLDCVLGCF